jgi:hypothetical protein
MAWDWDSAICHPSVQWVKSLSGMGKRAAPQSWKSDSFYMFTSASSFALTIFCPSFISSSSFYSNLNSNIAVPG